MKFAICDDSKEFLENIVGYIHKLDAPDLIYDIYENGEKLIEEYNNGKRYDAVMLDMEMDGINGLDVAGILRKSDEHLIIIFSTSYEKYMKESFEYEPFRFLVKPFEFEKFNDVYKKMCKKIEDKPGKLVFCENREHTRIYAEDILYFESKGHYIYIYLKNGTIHKLRKTVTQLEEILDKNIFVRTHRAFIINMMYIYKVTSGSVKIHFALKDIPISDSYRKQLNQSVSHYKERILQI